MHYIVAGVGYTGKRVCNVLRSDRVVLLHRSPLRENQNRFQGQRVDLDVDTSQILELLLPLPSPCTILYTVPPESLQNRRLENLLRILPNDVRRFVYLSTTGVYGDHRGAIVNETSTLRPATERAKFRLAAESRLLEWGAERDTEVFVLRVPGIYGPDRLGLTRLEAGDTVIREADANPGNRIHVDDLVQCCVAAMTTADAPAGTYNVGDGDHRTSTWFAKTVARLADLPAPNEVSREEASCTFSERRLSFLSDSRRIDTRKMRDTLGCQPRYADAEDGIRASLSGARKCS